MSTATRQRAGFGADTAGAAVARSSEPIGPYQKRIEELLGEAGFSGLVESRHVEAWMRCEFTTLNHLDPTTFDRLANECIACVVSAPSEASERLAQSFGLMRHEERTPDCNGDSRCTTHRGGAYNMLSSKECRR